MVSQNPASGRFGDPSPSVSDEGSPNLSLANPAPERTLISTPSAARPGALSTTYAVEVRTAPTPDRARPVAVPLEDDSRERFRPWMPAVTEEHAGRYRVSDDETKSELGRGGIGRVYVAFDGHLEREVAIKELLPEVMGGDETGALRTVSRFLREARVTGQLEHPNIVPVYELGRRGNGTLYYTMRVVRGRTLARAITEAQSLEERLGLVNHFSGLCQAIAYAHSRGVVHRDIKPENVMIGEFGETVVLDWGMAKVTGADGEEETGRPLFAQSTGDLTVDGSFCGTPLFMSPEQALGRVREVDERSDVWALGAVLYTILSGRPPFQGKTLVEILGQVKSAKVLPLRSVDPCIPAELAAVVQRALSPTQRDRYANARELAREIQAYQAGSRVLAYPYSSWDLLKRFVQRQRSAVLASAIGLAAVVALGATGYRSVVAERDRAVLAERRALTNEEAAKQNERRANHSLSEVLTERAQNALIEGASVDAALLSAHALKLDEQPETRGLLLAAISSGHPQPTRRFPALRGCTRIAFSFSDRRAACVREQTIEVWSLDRETRLWSEALAGKVTGLALASQSPVVGLVLSTGTFQIRSSSDGTMLFRRELAKPTGIALSADGNQILGGSALGGAVLWNRGESGPGRALRLGQSVSALAFATNGRVAVGGELGALAVFLEDGTRQVLAGHSGTVMSLAFAEHGRHLASAGADRQVHFWDIQTRAPIAPPLTHSDAVTAISWSEDRRFLAFGGKDRSFTVGQLRPNGRRTTFRHHDDAVALTLLSPDARELFTSSERDGPELWTLPQAELPIELGERGNVLSLATIGDRGLVSAGLGQNGVCLWTLPEGECSTRLPVRIDRVRALAVSSDGSRIAFAGSGTELAIWDLEQRVPLHVLEAHTDEARALAFSADRAWLASASLDARLRIFDVPKGQLIREFETRAPLQALAFVGSTRQLVAGDRDGMVSVWDAESTRLLERFRVHDDWILSMAISPNGRFLATGGADRRVRVWDLEARRPALDLAGHRGRILSLEYSADGRLLASAGEDKQARLWDAETGRLLAVLPAAGGALRAVRFGNRSRILITAGDDGVIRFYRIAALRTPGEELSGDLERRFQLQITGSRVVRR